MPDEQNSGSDTQTPANADTSGDQGSSTPAAGSGHVQDAETSKPTPAEESGHVDEKEEQRQKREEGTINKLRKEKEDQETRLSNLSSWIRSNPTRYRNALVDTAGMTEDQANAEVQKFHPNWQPKQKKQAAPQGQQDQQPSQPQFDPDTQAALNEVTQRHKEKEQKITQAVSKFLEEHPNMDKLTTQSVGMEAMRLVEMEGLEPQEALRIANIKITKPEEYKKEGEIEGMSKALSGVSASGSGTGGSQQPSTTEPSSLDKQVMDRLGISGNKDAVEIYEGFLNE